MGIAQRILPQPLAKAGSEILLIQHGKDNSGREAWYFVRIPSAKIRVFLADAEKGRLDISQFGTIVISGFGSAPPVEVVEHMRSVHGYKGNPL